MASITKGEIVRQALEMLMISGVTVGASNEDISMSLKSLEMLIPSWERKGVKIGYIKAKSLLDVNANDESGISDSDVLAATSNLAKVICSAFGKSCPPLIAEYARNTFRDLIAPPVQMMHNEMMPRGAGNNRNSIWPVKFTSADESLLNPELTNQMQIGEVNDYVSNFESYLHDCEDIGTFTIIADNGLTIDSSSNTVSEVNYRVTAVSVGDNPNEFKVVKITITTTDGRVEVRNINFNITE